MTFSAPGAVRQTPDPFFILNSAAKGIKDVYTFLIFSSAFMGLTGMAMVSISGFIQGIPPSVPALAIMFLVPFAVYNLNRGTDDEEDSVNRLDRYLFTKRFEEWLHAAAGIAYLCAFLIIIPFGIQAIALVAVPLVCGILYSMPLFPGFHRVKEVPLMKNLIVGISWALLTALVPVLTTGGIPDMKTWICLVFFFSYVFIGSIIPDIRDREGDALAGVITIPVLIGPERTSSLLEGMNCLVGIGLVLSSLSHLATPVLLLLIGGFSYTHGCIRLFRSSKTKNFVSDFLFDGQYIIFCIALEILLLLRVLS